MKTVLVTGGAGFIGSHVVDAVVAHGDRAVVVDDLSTGRKSNLRPEVPFYHVDIRDAAALEEVFLLERPDVVNHHAALADVRKSMEDPGLYTQVNVVGTVNILALSVRYGVQKMVFASTCAVYPAPDTIPVSETHRVQPLSTYGLTKYVGEKYLELYRDVAGFAFTAFRYGNVYGPRQDPKGEAGVVAIFSQQMLTGVRPTLFGNGAKTRDYVFVEDIAAANLLAMNGAGDREVFNLGWGREVMDFEVFEAVRQAVGVVVEPHFAPKRAGELDRIALDNAKARALLGWQPRVPFEEGARRTVEYYRER